MKRLIWGCTLSVGFTLSLLAGSAIVGGEAHAATTVQSADTTTCPVTTGTVNGSPVVLPATLTGAAPNSWDPGTATASSPATSSGTGQLAFTGTDVAGTAAVGGALLVGGYLLVRASRLRHDADAWDGTED